MAPRTCSGRATGCASDSTSGSGCWIWSALAVQRHRNRLASDHLHEHAIAVHYDDPDVVLIRNNRRVPPNANGLTSPLLSTKTRSAGTTSVPTQHSAVMNCGSYTSPRSAAHMATQVTDSQTCSRERE